MTPEHSGHVEAVYHAALKRASNERAAFLEEVCAGDEALRREVESLLGAAADVFLDEPALALRMVDAALLVVFDDEDSCRSIHGSALLMTGLCVASFGGIRRTCRA